MVIDEDKCAITGQPLPGRRRKLAERCQSILWPSLKCTSDVATVAELCYCTKMRVFGRAYSFSAEIYHLPQPRYSWDDRYLSFNRMTTEEKEEKQQEKNRLEKLFSIEDRGQTDRVTALPCPYALNIDQWPWPMTLTFNPRRAMVMVHTHTITQVQRSVGLRERMETNGRTDGRTDGHYRLLQLPG